MNPGLLDHRQKLYPLGQLFHYGLIFYLTYRDNFKSFHSVVGDSPMTRIMVLPKENINQELSW